MNENQETIADIIAEMRKECGDSNVRYLGVRIIHRMEDTRVMQYCDRLEAAWKREELRWAKANGELAKMLDCEKAQCGNAAEIRVALEGMCKASQDVFRRFARDAFAGERRLDTLGVAFDKAEAALSAPPRNCDVGTIEEQKRRFFSEHQDTTLSSEVAIDWMQQPYKVSISERNK